MKAIAILMCLTAVGSVPGSVWVWKPAGRHHLPGQEGRWQVQGHQPGQVGCCCILFFVHPAAPCSQHVQREEGNVFICALELTASLEQL